MIYRIIIEKGEDFGFIAHCPAIPGCHSQGSSMEAAIENIRDAIIGCLEVIDRDLIPHGADKYTIVEVAV
ncbi:MAG: type II toxin-antitoxin system HicB family antitoxin [Syntrophales bacterium]